ncbi:MAG: hypothetical protein ABI377_12130 [Devosia sp.]
MRRLLELSVPAAIAVVALIAPALAAQPAYLDDRSTAASLVRSFYNAVNRQEYARAYTYFGTSAPQPYASFASGYADTASVAVATGTAVSDGAAGSIYFTLPVAIDALSSNGTHKQFAGCYVTRLVEPTVQDPPVTPMFIYKASLGVAHGNIRALLPHCDTM